MNEQRPDLVEQIRRVVNRSGVSLRGIARAAKLDPHVVRRFMSRELKRGGSLPTLNAIADVLGLGLAARGPVRVPPPKGGPRRQIMGKQRPDLGEQFRRAVKRSGVDRDTIARAARIAPHVLRRFIAGKVGLSLRTLDALTAVLGLDLVARRPVRVPPGLKLKNGRQIKRRRHPDLGEQIRQAVNATGARRRAVSKAAKIDPTVLARFMAGVNRYGTSMVVLSALTDVLGLVLVARGPVRVPPPLKRGRKPKKGR